MTRLSPIVLCLCLAGCASLTAPPSQDDFEASFYRKICCAAIRIGGTGYLRSAPAEAPELRVLPGGTAFFVGVENDLYVVTARHVADKEYDLYANVPVYLKGTQNVRSLYLRLPKDRWVYHPESGDKDTHFVDVAAMKIDVPQGHRVECFRYAPRDGGRNEFAARDPHPGIPVITFGFPGDIGFSLTEPKPMCRLGVVSLVAEKKFMKMYGKFFNSRTFLVDADMLEGNSGSPLIRQPLPPHQEIQLLGLASASNWQMRFAIVEPVSRILETLEVAAKQAVEQGGFWSETLQ